jgi:hypothetical protein
MKSLLVLYYYVYIMACNLIDAISELFNKYFRVVPENRPVSNNH